MMKGIAFSLIAGLSLTACGGVQEIEATVPFNKAEAAYINKTGKATVSGQAFLKRRDGMVVTCAGAAAYLIPATEYAKQRFSAIYGNEDRGYRSAIRGFSDADDLDYYKYARETYCDAEGDFEFKGVADGEYFVTSTVVWQVSDYYNEGGILGKRITIKNGRSQNVILAN